MSISNAFSRAALRRLLVAAGVLTAVLPRTGGTDTPPLPYTIVDLGILSSGVDSVANGVNNRGQVVGRSGQGEFGHAFYWSEELGMQDLGTLPGGTFSEAFAINDSRWIAGSSQMIQSGTGSTRAFLWVPAAQGRLTVGLNDLDTLGGKDAEARGINTNGQVVGTAEVDSAGLRHAFRTGDAYYPADLGTIAGVSGDGSVAYAINNPGQIVGTSQFGGGPFSHAFRFFDANANGRPDAGEMVDLGTLAGDSDSSARAINNAGMVAGVSKGNAANRAVLWNAQGQISALPALPGYTVSSYALGINNGGTVVGAAYKDAATAHAFLYKNGVLRDLNDYLPPNSGWVLIEARSISDNGQIAGFGEHHGQRRAFLLKPLTISSSIPPAVDPCHTLTYTLTYRNAGTEPVANVVVRNRLPRPTTFVSAQNGGLFLGGEVVWNVGTLAAGASGSVTFTVAANDASGKIVNDFYTVEADGIFRSGGPPAETPIVGTGASIVDIGTLNGTYSNAQDINNAGQVVGNSVGLTRYDNGEGAYYEHAMLWSPNGGPQDLGTIVGFILFPSPHPSPAARSYGLAINDSGQVAGWSYHVPYDFSGSHQERAIHPFISSGGTLVDLIVPAEDRLERNGEAYGINNAGHVCGYFSIQEPNPDSPGQIRPTPPRSCLWKAPDQMTDLGTLGGPFDGGRAYDVNASDQVAGYSNVSTDQGLISRAYLWEGGTMTPLFEPGVRSVAYALNDKGQVVGQREWPDTGWTRAFLWSKEGGTIDLLKGFASDTTGSDAQGINNAGQVVGGYRGRPFLWEKGHAVDLNTLIPTDCGWTLYFAMGINEQGQITGNGDHFGQPRGFVLTPKPDQPPVLTNPKADPASLPKAGGPVSLTVNATDDRGVASARVEIAGPDGSPTKLDLTQTSTNRVTAWQGSFTAPPNATAQPRRYTVIFYATDTGGHEASSTSVAFTVAAGSTDTVPPVLTRAAVQPPVVPSAGKRVMLSVTATDNRAVATVSAAVVGPAQGTVTLRKVSGNSYRGEFLVPRNRTRKKVKYTATFSATDTAGNAARAVSVVFFQKPR